MSVIAAPPLLVNVPGPGVLLQTTPVALRTILDDIALPKVVGAHNLGSGSVQASFSRSGRYSPGDEFLSPKGETCSSSGRFPPGGEFLRPEGKYQSQSCLSSGDVPRDGCGDNGHPLLKEMFSDPGKL